MNPLNAVIGFLMFMYLFSAFVQDAGYLLWGMMLTAVITVAMGMYDCIVITQVGVGSCITTLEMSNAVGENMAVVVVAFVLIMIPKKAISSFIKR